MSSLRFADMAGHGISGDRNGWFPAGSIGQAADYRTALVMNTHASMSVTTGRLWVTPDANGGGFAIAILDGVARALGYNYGTVTPSSGSYSTPTDAATGLVVNTLAPGQQILIGVKRDLSTGTTALPEYNVIHVDAVVPAGYV